MEQRSEEWFEARLGKATASRFNDVMAVLKNGGEAATRKNYRAQLVAERITGQQADHFTSAPMQWGTDTEDLARVSYSLLTGYRVDEAGFIEMEDMAVGGSPDGLIGADGGVEIKCPNTANHIDILKAGKMPPQYMAQVQGCMMVTGRKWWDFVSFDPIMPARTQIFIQRIERNEAYILELKGGLKRFLAEVDADQKFLEEYNG